MFSMLIYNSFGLELTYYQRILEYMKKLSHIINWCLAIIVAFIMINIVCFFYERQPGWHDTPNGASLAVRMPYSLIVHGTEGYSITRVDKNGYLNPDMQLADHYILMMGASHTQGKEISPDKKYSVLVNDLYFNDSKLHTYNISCDGSFLPSQIKHFKAAMETFPDADVVTIEILSTDYSVDEIKDSLIQAEYDPSDTAVYFENMSLKEKARTALKSYIPMLSKIKKNMLAIEQAKQTTEKTDIDFYEYQKEITKALALIRSECNVPLVIIYHPETSINQDGSLSLKYSDTWDIFYNACKSCNIDVIDSGNDFLQYYENNNVLPYGFSNSAPGTGHLNKIGHQIIANEIIDYLEELK